MIKVKFFRAFLLGLFTAAIFYGTVLFCIMPLCNVEGWLKDVLRQKQEIAQKTPSPKIIILGGSNAFWGMRSNLLEQKCCMPTVNLAFHAGFSIAFYKSLLMNTINPRDIIIMPLELGHYSSKDTLNSISLPAFCGWGKSIFKELDTSACSLFMFYGFSYISGNLFFSNFTDIASRRIKNILNRNHHKSQEPFTHSMVYNAKNMNQYGDIVRTWNAGFELKEKLIPNNKEKFPSAYFVEEYNKLQQFIHSRGARVFLTWPVLCTKDSLEELKIIQKQCADAGIIIHGEPKDFMFPPEAFSDTSYHLKSCFAEQRTEKLAAVLNTLLK